jgi:hypothetical protein
MRNAIFFILLTVLILFLLYFVGIPVLGKFTTFVTNLRTGNKQISKSDTTPPPPPKFNYFSEFTNQESITITGNTEAGASVKLTLNSSPQEVLADNNGSFTFSLNLQNGVNTLSAVSTDQSGNQSQISTDSQITFDNKPPELSITSPSDGTSFFGSNQRQITVQGKTETGAEITINDRIIAVDETGIFQYTTTLNEGGNSFNVKSKDQAGNITENTISFNFTP